MKKCIVSEIEKSWYYAFYDGKIYFIFPEIEVLPSLSSYCTLNVLR